ncbi:GAF and ANTAR domain-containing protein [Klenkia brasiliensis]|uniref:ANTAR domain-containing protein n=1 Tax=Klenkia brasiliensis TaxID=333142 RepID=A0A1G7XZ41_9ACTN|nr:GAF and ANTAR domain-containing protein [Klenkia brasiliensis]SDG89448.1 ANTAR domain-containing protein [Klenkia brasiliensis]
MTPSQAADPRRDPAGGVADQLLGVLLRDCSPDDVQRLLTRAVLAAVPAADAVSVTVATPAGTTSAAWTGLLAHELDEAQRVAGSGPCTTAARTAQPQLLPDVRTDDRWPQFRAAAVRQGALSCAALPVPVPVEGLGVALGLYASAAGALTEETTGHLDGELRAVGVVLANVDEFARARAEVDQLREAVAHRAVIEQAKGMLAARTGVTPEEAFDQLRVLSSHTNTKVRALAQQVVSRTLPEELLTALER